MVLEKSSLQNFKWNESWRKPNATVLIPERPFGIEDVSNLYYKLARKKSYRFNLMVVGESGMGKTTFMNTLFQTDLTENISPLFLSRRKTMEIQPKTFELEEDGIRLILTIIDTPGLGEQTDRDSSDIVQYIDSQYQLYMEAETALHRPSEIIDSRVHAVLYFIAPTGHSLKEVDINFLQLLTVRTNVIPVIAKADTLNQEELQVFKQNIMEDLAINDITVYPNLQSEESEYLAEFQSLLPFSVIGSDQFYQVEGRSVRGRSYRWGVVEVENEEHCDVIKLRKLLMEISLFDLIQTTHHIFYERYRAVILRQKGRPRSFLPCDDGYQDELHSYEEKLKDLSEQEQQLKAKYMEKIRTKDQEIKHWEDGILFQYQSDLEKLEQELKAVDLETKEIDALLDQYGFGSKSLLRKFTSKRMG